MTARSNRPARLRPTAARARHNHWLTVALATLAFGFAAIDARATNFDVSSTLDDGSTGTLRWAIGQANAAGAGAHTITFSVAANSTIELASDLPQLDNSSATIVFDGIGAGGVTISGHNAYRVLFVVSGTWDIRNLNIINGLGQGGNGGTGRGGGGGGLGAGGALFVNTGANVTIRNVNFSNNNAVGGNGGAANFSVNAGGGGGGFHGSGGTAGTFGGGGGGGAGLGRGGNGGSTGGGGGGGLLLDGSPGVASSGGAGAPLGGNGGNAFNPGQSGSTFGGGGGGGALNPGGTGGAFAGGGGGGNSASGAAGGFGGGGGGSGNVLAASGGFGAGYGGFSGSSGNGGSGYGGAVFVRQGGSLTIDNSTTTGNGVTAGTGFIGGDAAGQDLYLMSGTSATFGGTTNNYSGSLSGDGSVVQSAGTTTLSGTNTYTGGTTISGGTLVGDTNSLQGAITNNSRLTFDQTFNGVNQSAISGSGDLLKTGSGTVFLNGTNSYNGGTTVNAGILQGHTDSLQGGILNNATVQFSQNFDGTYAGNMSGSGALVKDGSGTVTLSGTNSYSGGTTVNAGALAGNTGSLQGDIVNNATVAFSQSLVNPGTYAGNMSGSGTLIKNGAGTLFLTGTNSYSGGTTINSGYLVGDTGSLQGAINNSGVVEFTQASDGTYSGIISGSGALLKGGAANLTLTGANNFTGGTTIAAGTLTVNTASLSGDVVNQGTLVFDQTSSGTFAGQISSTGNVIKTGTGALDLTGTNTYTGTTDVQAGALAVNGSLTSNTTVDAGAILGGNGTINGNLVNNGTVAPGNSIGTLTVNGSYTVNAGTTQHVQINDAGTTPGVNNDLLVVNGATTLNGGTVQVDPAAGTYSVGSRYVFLESTTRSGQYANIVVNGLTGFRVALGYGDIVVGGTLYQTAYFDLLSPQTDFAAIAETFNQLQIAIYLDNASLTASPDLQVLLDQISALPPDGQRYALNALTAEVNATLAQLRVQDTTFLYMMLRRRVGSAFASAGLGAASGGQLASSGGMGNSGASILPVSYSPGASTVDPISPMAAAGGCCPSWGGWTAGYGMGGSASGDGNASGGTYGAGGTLLGAERVLDDYHLAGLFGAYSHLNVRLTGLPQSASADQGQFGGYFLRDQGLAYTLAAGSIGFVGYRQTRQVPFSGTATADYGGWLPSAYLERGIRWQLGEAMLQPYAALQYVYSRQNAFTETGAGVANLSVAGTDTHALRGLLGARLSQTWLTSAGRTLVPELRAAWMHEFLEPDTTLTAIFAPVGGPSFATRGLNFGRDWAVLGTGTQYAFNDRVSLFANYDLLFNVRQAWNAGSGGVQVTW